MKQVLSSGKRCIAQIGIFLGLTNALTCCQHNKAWLLVGDEEYCFLGAFLFLNSILK